MIPPSFPLEIDSTKAYFPAAHSFTVDST